MSERTHCNKPDRDVPGIVCGYPLPCPHHTAIIEITDDRVKVDLPKAAAPHDVMKTTRRLIEIGKAIAKGLGDAG